MILFQVDKNSPLPNDKTPVVEEGVGQNLFTFSSETASLIKFLTVAHVSSTEAKDSLSSQLKTCHGTEDIALKTESKEEKELDICCNCNINHNENQSTSVNVDHSCNCMWTSLKEWKSGASSEPKNPCISCASAKMEDHESPSGTSLKNLIFVTGEFAVALHQLGIKNVSSETLCKQTSSSNEVDEMEVSEGSHHMVVNFSNNDIHVQPLRKSDKPDHLIDLFGHVTGLCLSRDSRQVIACLKAQSSIC